MFKCYVKIPHEISSQRLIFQLTIFILLNIDSANSSIWFLFIVSPLFNCSWNPGSVLERKTLIASPFWCLCQLDEKCLKMNHEKENWSEKTSENYYQAEDFFEKILMTWMQMMVMQIPNIDDDVSLGSTPECNYKSRPNIHFSFTNSISISLSFRCSSRWHNKIIMLREKVINIICTSAIVGKPSSLLPSWSRSSCKNFSIFVSANKYHTNNNEKDSGCGMLKESSKKARTQYFLVQLYVPKLWIQKFQDLDLSCFYMLNQLVTTSGEEETAPRQ